MADSRPKVGLDIDGCLASFSAKFIEMGNARFGLANKASDQYDWQFNPLLTAQQVDELWKEIENTENWWRTLDKLSGSDALTEVADNFRIYFITSRIPTVGLPIETQTAHWLLRHYFIPFPTVIVSSHKGPLAAALNLDYFLDDRPENCADVMTFNPGTEVYLQDAPYNQDFKARRATRVSSVNEFFQTIGGVSGSASKAA